MSRWANDPERAADALIERSLDEIALSGHILLVNQHGALPARIATRGLTSTLWNRRIAHNRPADPWPPAGPFDGALVRLPKAADEQEMTAHAVLSVLKPGNRLILYGGNDEGIRSAARMLETVAQSAMDTLATRGHGRVLAATRQADIMLKDKLADWRIVAQMEIAGVVRPWINYPGTFAAGRLDEGTALLLSALPSLPTGARVLDYGCGSGVISAAMLAAGPGITVDMLDIDTVALAAASENVPEGRTIAGTRVTDAGHGYGAIVSNPPLHQTIAQDHAMLEQLIADAPVRLAPGGILQMVVQRRIPLDRLLGKHFRHAEVVAENGRYRVWRAKT